jgi:hypothetical protein
MTRGPATHEVEKQAAEDQHNKEQREERVSSINIEAPEAE